MMIMMTGNLYSLYATCSLISTAKWLFLSWNVAWRRKSVLSFNGHLHFAYWRRIGDRGAFSVAEPCAWTEAAPYEASQEAGAPQGRI